MFDSTYLLILVTVGVSMGCPSSHIPIVIQIPKVTQHDTSFNKEPLQWRPRINSYTEQYLIKDTAMILMTNDSISTQKTITSSRKFFIALSVSGDSLRLTASLDSSEADTQSQASKRAVVPYQEFSAMLSAQGQVSSLFSEYTSDCGHDLDRTVMRVEDLIIPLPTRALQIGDQWSDTTVQVTCRGRIAIREASIRNYMLTELSQSQHHNAAKIKRTTLVILQSVLRETRAHLTAQGSGTSAAVLYVDRATGMLLSNDTKSQLALIIGTNSSTFSFKQILASHITGQF